MKNTGGGNYFKFEVGVLTNQHHSRAVHGWGHELSIKVMHETRQDSEKQKQQHWLSFTCPSGSTSPPLLPLGRLMWITSMTFLALWQLLEFAQWIAHTWEQNSLRSGLGYFLQEILRLDANPHLFSALQPSLLICTFQWLFPSIVPSGVWVYWSLPFPAIGFFTASCGLPVTCSELLSCLFIKDQLIVS
jgi:hypothetical protein